MNPPSTCSSLMPRRASSSSIFGRSTFPLSFGSTTTSAFGRRLALAAAKTSDLVALQDRAPVGGVSRRLSITTRSGWRGVSTSRTVSCGSSARTVPAPVSMAQARARQRWPSLPRLRPGDPLRLAVGERGAPVERRRDLHAHPGPAARHARDEADVELPRLVLHQPVLEPRCPRRASAVAALRRLRDWDRASPRPRAPRSRLISASAQGGVRPWWLQGSSVT